MSNRSGRLRATATHPHLHERAPVPRRPPGRCRGEVGQAGLLVGLLVLVLAAGAAVLTATLGGAVAERTRARTAADAAALAGVTGGRGSAEVVAVANGGHLESYGGDGSVVEVAVVVGATRATARAAPAFRTDGRPSRSAGAVAIDPTRTCSEVGARPDPCGGQRIP